MKIQVPKSLNVTLTDEELMKLKSALRILQEIDNIVTEKIVEPTEVENYFSSYCYDWCITEAIQALEVLTNAHKFTVIGAEE